MAKETRMRLGAVGPIEWMAQNPIAANLLMLLLLGGGIWFALAIQKEVQPPFELDIVQASVVYPGAAPEEVEQAILLPIEEAVKGVQGIKEMTSRAGEGRGEILFELVVGMDRIKVYQEIDQAISRIRTFPDVIEKPEVMLQTQQRDVMRIGLYGDADIWTLRRLSEGLRDRLLNDRKITQVEIHRVPDYVTHVEIPSELLRKYNLTLADVANMIQRSSQDIPAGAVDSHQGQIVLRMKERRLWSKELGSIIIVPSDRGSPVRLKDVAHIEDGFEEIGFHGQFNQKPSITIRVYRVGTQSPLAIAEAVQSIADDFETTLPPGIQLRIDSNAARDFGDRLALLKGNAIYAVIVVFLILTLLLEVRLAFWVMMGMCVSFLGGLVLVGAVGVSINMISMFAFLVVLGIVVDDAIVVGENVYEYRQQGMPALSAAIMGAKDMAGPVIFSILTTMVAFVPLMFLPGTTGKFWFPIPVVVILVLAVSLLEALFILPAHLAHASTSSQNRIHRIQQGIAKYLSRFVQLRYGAFLRLILKHRYITLTTAVALLMIVGGYAGSGHMGMIMMPELSADEIEAGVRLPVGTTPSQVAKVANEITASTARMFKKYDLYRVAYGIKANVRRQNSIDVEIVMRPPDEHDWTAADIIRLWREEIGDIDGVRQISFEGESGPGGYLDDIMVDLSHEDIDKLEGASQAFVDRVKLFESTRDVNDNYNKGKVQFDFELRPQAMNLGLTSEDVGRQVRHAFYGAVAKRQLRGVNEVEVRVKLPREERQSLSTLENLVVFTPDKTQIPLMEVARVKESEAFNSIHRRDGRRIITVGMNVEPKRAMGRVREAIEQDLLPQLRAEYPGLTWTFQGVYAEMGESTRSLWGSFALAMAVVYALLAIAFSSYVQPLIVMMAIPFGIVGAVIGHMLLGFDLSLVSLMGVIALSGVVVNDALIMVHAANKMRNDKPALAAIQEAGVRRFRPIVLTTLTTFAGLAPIILERSRQAYHLVPMAISLGFGIVFSTAIILVIVPCLYMMLDDFASLFTRITVRRRNES